MVFSNSVNELNISHINDVGTGMVCIKVAEFSWLYPLPKKHRERANITQEIFRES